MTEQELRALAAYVDLPEERDLAPAVHARLRGRPARRGWLVVAFAAGIVAVMLSSSTLSSGGGVSSVHAAPPITTTAINAWLFIAATHYKCRTSASPRTRTARRVPGSHVSYERHRSLPGSIRV